MSLKNTLKYNNEQLRLYAAWFNSLMALESLSTDSSIEEKSKVLISFNKARQAAVAAGVPGIY